MAPRATGRGRTTNTTAGGSAPPGGFPAAGTTPGVAARGKKQSRNRLRRAGAGNGGMQHFSITRGTDGTKVEAEQFIGGLVGWMQLNGICRTDAEAKKAYLIGMQHVNTLIGTVPV